MSLDATPRSLPPNATRVGGGLTVCH